MKTVGEKEVVNETEQTQQVYYTRYTYNDLKDNENLVYYNDGLVNEYKPSTNDFEGLIDIQETFIHDNEIKPIEAPENASYIDYIRVLLKLDTMLMIKEIYQWIGLYIVRK